MEDRLRIFIEELFNGTAVSKKSVELKEEMIQNLNDKYKDLVAEGKTPEAAYNIAVAGVGDVSGLLKELEADAASAPDMEKVEAARRKSAMLTAIAVMMYILSVLPFFILNQMRFMYVDANAIGIPVLFVMVAGATGLLVYNNMTKPKRFKGSETIVEDFREWQTDTQSKKSMRRSISSALWSVITVLYFIISFTTHAWHITWIIFLIGAAIESFINIFTTTKK